MWWMFVRMVLQLCLVCCYRMVLFCGLPVFVYGSLGLIMLTC